MAYSRELANQIREALTDEKLTVGATNSFGLSVRCNPEQVDDMLIEKGAQRAEMDGRQMSKGWMVVPAEEVTIQENLNFRVGVALKYNEEVTHKSV